MPKFKKQTKDGEILEFKANTNIAILPLKCLQIINDAHVYTCFCNLTVILISPMFSFQNSKRCIKHYPAVQKHKRVSTELPSVHHYVIHINTKAMIFIEI